MQEGGEEGGEGGGVEGGGEEGGGPDNRAESIVIYCISHHPHQETMARGLVSCCNFTI